MPDGTRAAAIARCVIADARAGRFAAWGMSTVVDEFVGEAVLAEEVVVALHRLAHVPSRFPVGNAGVLHVYGYWFAPRPTPFGYKRDRWVDGRLASAFGLPREAFIPGADPKATPLQRVTEVGVAVLEEPRSAFATADAVVGDALTRVCLARSAGQDAMALVYGVVAADGARLLTTFPVEGEVSGLVEDFAARPRWRWNAVGVAEP